MSGSIIITILTMAVILYFCLFRKYPDFFKNKRNIVITCISLSVGFVLVLIIRHLPNGFQLPIMFAVFFGLMIFSKISQNKQGTKQKTMLQVSNSSKKFLRRFIELQAQRNKLIGQYSERMGQNFFAVYPMIILIALPAALITLLSFAILDGDYALLRWIIFISVLVIDMVLTFNSEKIINNEEKQLQNKRQFYAECQSHGIGRSMKSHQKQKAELIAQRLGCKYNDIVQYYIEAEEICLEDSARRRLDQLEETRESERQKCIENNRYSDYFGRNKRIAILEDIQYNYRKKAEEMKKSTRDVVRYSQKREINSGVAGGLASGLLGGVAGVAAFIDAENQNEQIRSLNKATMDALSPGVFAVMNRAYDYEREADKLQYSIDDAKIKLVSDVPSEKVFSYMDIIKKTVEISETGAFTITADIKITADKKMLKIGNEDGVVDGTLEAEMYQNGQCVGSALMVLPTFGVKDTATIEGIAIAEANVGKPYKIKFKPYRLWIMEE